MVPGWFAAVTNAQAASRAVDGALVRFGPFVLDLARGRLLRDGLPVEVPPRPFELLCCLARQPGRVVPRHELLDALWGRDYLGDSTLKATVNNLRRALGEDGKSPRWIINVARRGYCLQADEVIAVRAVDQPAAAGRVAVDDGLLGREADCLRIERMVVESRLVTVLGSSGIGKTRLVGAVVPALRERFDGALALVRLHELRTVADLVPEIAQGLALPDPAPRSPAALAQALSRRRACVVLDNCEHVAKDLAPLLADWLAHAPGLHVLATSQVRIGLPMERRLVLRPLALPPAGADLTALGQHAAGALMLRRLRELRPDLEPTSEQAAALADICRALDGVPLEIELAASRIQVLGLDTVRAHLDDRLELLRQQGHGIAARHRSLRSAIEHSHRLLTEHQRRVLHRLSVFESSFRAHVAQQLLGETDKLPPWEAVDLVEQLVNHSLVAAAEGEPRNPGAALQEPRWRLLQSLRLFAAEQLARNGQTDRTRDAHLRVMTLHLRQQMHDAHDVPIRDWAARLRPDLPDLRAAFDHAAARSPEQAWALWALLVLVWLRSGLPQEAMRSWQRLQDSAAAPLDPQVRADCALAEGLMCLYNLPVDLSRGLEAIGQAIRLNAELDRPVLRYHALYVQGHLQLRTGRPLAELDTLQAMAALEREDWPLMRRRYRRLLVGIELARQGRVEDCRRHAEEELARARELGQRDYIWTCQHGLGQALFACGDVAGATELFAATWAEIAAAGQAPLYWSTEALTAVLLAARDARSARGAVVSQAVRRLWQNRQLHLACTVPSWLCAWDGRWSDAARLLGWAEALAGKRGEQSGPILAWAARQMRQWLDDRLPASDLRQRLAEGASLDESVVPAIAWPGEPLDGSG